MSTMIRDLLHTLCEDECLSCAKRDRVGEYRD